jgi:hypothetical protein
MLLSVVVVTAGLVALPAPGIAAAEPAAPPDFYSSFETGDPQPTWNDTVDTDAAGKPKAFGVNGANGTAIPGDIRGKVTESSASSENTAGGEVVANLLDGSTDTKWLSWDPTAWAQFTLSQPTAITHYAISSANDHPERDPKDWTLQGSNDGIIWTQLDKQTDQSFSARFQQKDYKIAPTAPYRFFRLDITRNNGGPPSAIRTAARER